MIKPLICFLVLICAIVSARATDLPKLMAETQRLAQDGQRMTLVWWIPSEFWEITLQKNANISEAQRKQFVDVLSQYVIFAVAELEVGAFGGLTPKSRPMILSNTELTVNGKRRNALSDTEMSADAANFVGMMKPMMSQMLGQIGQGLEFVLYPNSKEGESRVSAVQKGNMAYQAFGRKFDWKLPLSSMLPPKIDPTTKQEFPGDYSYNPYTGAELVAK